MKSKPQTNTPSSGSGGEGAPCRYRTRSVTKKMAAELAVCGSGVLKPLAPAEEKASKKGLAHFVY